ncbi:MAG: type II toxin-antitoxin system HipA family toxin [Pseudohongiellaceae bacterium]
MAKTSTLNLWYENQLVGNLWNNELDRIGFRYSDDWLASETKFPISLQLPLQAKEFLPDEGKAHRFFSNLLPEAQARAQIINDLKIPDSDYSLLEAIGGECAGAFNILPDQSGPESRESWGYTELSKKDLKTLIKRRGSGINFRNNSNKPIRLSLAGAQNKCPILITDNGRFLPSNEAATSHILKFQVTDYPHIPAYETILMKLAKSIGMNVAKIELRALDGLPASEPEKSFVEIERYDRVKDSEGNIFRLHQEDFCQALGYGYNKKYQSDGGPSFSDCLNLIREYSVEPAEDTIALIEWQIFNFLAGNSDGHAKNLSILYSEDHSPRLAPFYDLVCTRAIERIDTSLAFAIGQEHNPGRIYKRNWEAFATEIDINANYLIKTVQVSIEKILDSLPNVFQNFKEDYGEYAALQRVNHFIRCQCHGASQNLK